MAAQTTITINDGATTPVAHAFEPAGAFAMPDGRVRSRWIDRTGSALAIGRAELTESHAPDANGAGNRKVREVLVVPTVELVNGVNTVTRRATIVVEVTTDQGSTQAELDNLAAYVKNFTASTYFQDKVKKNEVTW